MRTLGAGLGLCAWLLLAVPRALGAEQAADPVSAARVHHEAGLQHYAARDFAAAARAFAAAYALDPRRESLFGQAQATRLLGDCVTATRLYQDFLATAPPPQQVEATRLALARCATPPVLTATPAPAPVPAPSSAKPVGVVVAAPTLARPPWWQDRVGQALAGGAALGLATAGGFLAAAVHADREARAAAGYHQYDERRQVAEDRARWSGRVALAGLALAAAAGGRFLWVGLRAGGGVGGVEGRF